MDFPNPIDNFFVNLFSQLSYHYSTEIFIAIILQSIYFYVFFMVYFYFRSKQKTKLIHFIITLIIGFGIVFGLKYYIDRPRPFITFNLPAPVIEKGDPAFPSAHSFLAFFLYPFLSRVEKLKRFKKFIGIHLLLLVPIGSMLLNVHYLTDVFGGAFIGFVIPKIISESSFGKFFKQRSS